MELFESVEHPNQALVVQFCHLILGADPSIEAGTKWNSVSFRTSEWFATLNKRAFDRVEFVFHLGAKVKAVDIRDQIPDIPGCLTWKSADRCIVTFRVDEIDDQLRNHLQEFVKAWIKFL